jgi:hypothetical protein
LGPLSPWQLNPKVEKAGLLLISRLFSWCLHQESRPGLGRRAGH